MKRFAFLIHPRQAIDVGRRMGNIVGIGERLGMILTPQWLVKMILPKLSGRMGFSVCSKFDVFGEAEGYIIAIALTARQMLTLPNTYVRQRILDAVLFAQNELGVEGIGLGAYISSLTTNGQWLARHPDVKVWVTHGDSYSSALAIDGIEKAVKTQGLNLKTARVAVVGAYGLIGSIISQALVEKCDNLVLIGRRIGKFNSLLKKKDFSKTMLSEDINDARAADLIVTATTSNGSLLNDGLLKKSGVIVYDISQPYNLSPQICRRQSNVVRIDGSLASIDNLNLGFEMGPPKGATFGCLAETIMQSLSGDRRHHVGEITMEHLCLTQRWAKEIGFGLAPFTNFGKPITLGDSLIKGELEVYKKHTSPLEWRQGPRCFERLVSFNFAMRGKH